MAGEELDLARSMTIARDTRGKGLAAQVAEIAQLAFRRNRLVPNEYFAYRLYDDQLYDDAEKRRFLGETAYFPLIRATCDMRWWAVGTDKVLGHTLLGAYGVPQPQVHALYHPFRRFPGAPTLRNAAELAAFLRSDMPYPFFHKPVSGVQSRDVHLVRSIDRDTDTLRFHDDRTESVEAFCARIDRLEGENKGDGHLFQEVVRLHPELEKRVGPAVSTVRVLVFVEDDGPHVVQALWKVIGGSQIADNYWRSGNLLAHIDLETGRVTRLVSGKGPDTEELHAHPATGEPLVDFVLPHWPETIELVRTYSSIAHKVRFQGWDVAICEDGPKVIEINVGSAVDLPQHASGRGFRTDAFERFLEWATEVNETAPRGFSRYMGRL